MPEVWVEGPEVRAGGPAADAGGPEVDRLPGLGHDHPGRPRGGLRERRQRQPVHRGRDRATPAERGAVRAAAPGRRPPVHAAQPAEQQPHRGGQPGRARGQPGGGGEQVDGEVGGELDRRLQLVVHGRRHGGGRCPPRDRGDRGGRPERRRPGRGPVRAVGQPVDPQRRRPPGQVRTVPAGAPGGGTTGELTAPGARRAHRDVVVRGRGGRHAQHAARQADRQPERQVGGVRRRGVGAEQPEPAGVPGDGQLGRPDRCQLDRHVLPSREVVAAAGEGAAGKGEVTDDGARGPLFRTPPHDRVTQPLPDPSAAVDDPPPDPGTSRHHRTKGQVSTVLADR
ncbi:hypothetical protein GCM10023328_08320 [Modestobacter marinus]|uniref:Uncharacterized protein n=1 Tax=Modestobacter marinus TaxID=477641 RepID=A0A846LN19_9ACTN|nr:hypothetical protein [Modestobacter marinus]GGL48814.1 hypothetical protein GCM10011589_01640 [Modestobacter marinus]